MKFLIFQEFLHLMKPFYMLYFVVIVKKVLKVSSAYKMSRDVGDSKGGKYMHANV